MIAKGIFLANDTEIDEAERLGYKKPMPEYVELEMVFDINSVEVAFLNNTKKIVLFFKSAGRFEVVYEKELFDKLKNHLK